MIDERLILVSLFLPITGHAYLNSSQDDRQPILSSYARTSKKKRVTDSIQSTAPANRYHIRSESDTQRLPFDPKHANIEEEEIQVGPMIVEPKEFIEPDRKSLISSLASSEQKFNPLAKWKTPVTSPLHIVSPDVPMIRKPHETTIDLKENTPGLKTHALTRSSVSIPPYRTDHQENTPPIKVVPEKKIDNKTKTTMNMKWEWGASPLGNIGLQKAVDSVCIRTMDHFTLPIQPEQNDYINSPVESVRSAITPGEHDLAAFQNRLWIGMTGGGIVHATIRDSYHLQSSLHKSNVPIFSSAPTAPPSNFPGGSGLASVSPIFQNQILSPTISDSSSKNSPVGTTLLNGWIVGKGPKEDLQQEMELMYGCVPVWAKAAEIEGHYNSFCKEILWPTMHYILPEHARKEIDENESWKNYVKVNQNFADKVIATYRPNDIIWINDYHLFLVPKMVREKLPFATIGFFLHIPFPSSEVFRCLHVRKQLLEGVLGADLIGFQTYPFARHFIQTCSRILGLETTPKGIVVERRVVTVGIFAIGIDPDGLIKKHSDPEVKETIQMLKEKFSGKQVIVGRDKLDPVKGVRQKLLAFELFLNTYTEFQGKVILVQVALSTTEHPDLQRQILDLVSRINYRFGSIEYTPVLYLHQDIPFSTYLALLSIADACLITSLRDGMNLTSHEYVVCQNEEGRGGPLILSEFAGTYGSLGAAIRINPFNYKEVAKAIKDALTMPVDEKIRTHRELYRHVTSNTGSYWARSFVNELRKVAVDRKGFWNVIPALPLPFTSISLNHRKFDSKVSPVITDCFSPLFNFESGGIVESPSGQIIPVTPSENMWTSRFQTAGFRIIFLSFDNVMWPMFNDCGQEFITISQNELSQAMKKTLIQICKDPKTFVFVLSGLRKSELELWIGDIPRIGLCAENGCFLRPPDSKEWTSLTPDLDDSWTEKVMEIFEYYTERTPGSKIERKDVSMLWHYKDADTDFGSWQAKELQNHISDAIESISPVHVFLSSRQYLEVRPKLATKHMAVFKILQGYGISTGVAENSSPSGYKRDVIKGLLSKSVNPFSGISSPIGTPIIPPVIESVSKKGVSELIVDTPISASSKSVETTNPFVIYIGEDREDENAFNFLNGIQCRSSSGIWKMNGEMRNAAKGKEESVRLSKYAPIILTATIGSKLSKAYFYLDDLQNLMVLMDWLGTCD